MKEERKIVNSDVLGIHLLSQSFIPHQAIICYNEPCFNKIENQVARQGWKDKIKNSQSLITPEHPKHHLFMKDYKLAPSLLAADFACLSQQVYAVETARVEWLHLDVMDGRFVPNISFGPLVLEALRPLSKLFFDVHLMIEEPERYVEAFAKAGADMLTVHVEACPHLQRNIQQIKDLGVKAGVTLNPATPLSTLEEILPEVDLVLIMSVNPGFGGQAYIPSSTKKIVRLRQMLDDIGSQAELEVDGGIKAANIAEVVDAGASVVVAGSAVFNEKLSVAESISQLRIVTGAMV